MIEDYAMYSEEEYINKIQLLNIYNGTISECIWEEVLAYRKRYEYILDFKERKYYLTLNKSIFYKMNRIYECKTDAEESLSLNFYPNTNKNKSNKDNFLFFLKENNINMDAKLFHFLNSEEIFLIKVFILKLLFNNKDLISYYLMLNHHMDWSIFLSKIQIPSFENIDSSDLTYTFRFFLDNFYFHLTNKVVPLNSGTLCDENSLNELILLYPMLSTKKITFFYYHHRKNHYYTIKNYMEFNNVSYESARQAMEQLTNMDWYQKIKIGKKFVYMPSK